MTTPMFQQFHALKAKQPDAILFFRMGDFYETFYEDAKVTARILELTLTARNKSDPDPIPMAGVPHHAAAGYIQRLVDAGHRVAIAEQMEDPSKAKGLVKRDIVRVVTPGVVLDPTSLEASLPNHLVAIHRGRRKEGWGLACLDASTGDLRLTSVDTLDAVIGELHRLEPREALLSRRAQGHADLDEALFRHRTVISEAPAEAFDRAEAVRELTEALGVSGLEGFGVTRGEPGVCAAGAVMRYARETMGDRVSNVHRLRTWRPGGFMVLDDTTRRNLELTRTLLGGRREGTLLSLLDRTATAMGSRRLREWLAFPLLDIGEITQRQRAIEALRTRRDARRALTDALRQVADLERIGARIAHGTAHARDLAGLRRSLAALPEGLAPLAELEPLRSVLPRDVCEDVCEELRRWLVEDPPISLTDGGLIAQGVHDELDELVRYALEGRTYLAELEAREREATGIGSLKVRKNKVFGYFIEVTRAHYDKVPEHYLRKQTLSNCERYITPELKELEEKVLGADERRKSLEYGLFADLRTRISEHGVRLSQLARELAELDVLAALAEVAEVHRWTRPTWNTEGVLAVREGRHPVVEAALRDEPFVPNDVHLDRERRLIILTGPNMSGKSTIMRQVAILQLLAQVGSFVPAAEASVSVCDRIFTRVGAADDLARGQSTFMVEMAETSSILHHATDKSLVILDEIGRGTSTYDGLSIAWAVAEDLVDRVQCRALFATHYHELCELAESTEGVVNQSVAVSESGEEILFLRQLQDGGASRSYGIQCARLAGLPRDVVARARQLLTHFEKHAPRNDRSQLSLFGAVSAPAPAPEVEAAPDPLREAVAALDPDAMSPRDALDALYRLREITRDG